MRVCFQWGCLAIAMLGAGCGGGGGGVNALPTVPAQGTVTLDGKPFGPGTLNFLPQAKEAEKRKAAAAHVEADGKFSAKSYKDGDGMVPGEYSVMVSVDLGQGMAPNTEPLKIKIGEKGDTNLAIALKSQKGPGALMSPVLNTGGAGTSLKRP